MYIHTHELVRVMVRGGEGGNLRMWIRAGTESKLGPSDRQTEKEIDTSLVRMKKAKNVTPVLFLGRLFSFLYGTLTHSLTHSLTHHSRTHEHIHGFITRRLWKRRRDNGKLAYTRTVSSTYTHAPIHACAHAHHVCVSVCVSVCV